MNAFAGSRPTAWVRPRLRFLGREWSSFQVCGAAGLLVGSSLAMGLAGHAGLSRAVLCGMLAVAALVFFTLAMATKVLTGRESLVYYHHEVAILAACAALLLALGLPVLPYLDLMALGLGTFLACGRQGCLMVGCCHGKPHAWGVNYSEAHAAEGFPRRYVGVRLFPVQSLESLLVLCLVLGGAVLVLQDRPPGTALSWYVASYSSLRIWLEELRGDWARPCWHRLSEAQWTSVLILLGVVASEWQGRLPLSGWHVAMLAASLVSVAVLAMGRKTTRAILQAAHVGEIAAIVQSAPSTADDVAVRRTSLSICLSTQRLDRPDAARAMLVSLSRADRHLTFREARALARVIARLVPARGGSRRELLDSRLGVFHLILHETLR